MSDEIHLRRVQFLDLDSMRENRRELTCASHRSESTVSSSSELSPRSAVSRAASSASLSTLELIMRLTHDGSR